MVALTTGSQVHRVGVFQAPNDLTQSTATAEQSITAAYDVANLGMGTATGFGVNKYVLPTSGYSEGQRQWLLATATGEAKVRLGNGAATGAYVFQSANDYVEAIWLDGQWLAHVVSGATLATST